MHAEILVLYKRDLFDSSSYSVGDMARTAMTREMRFHLCLHMIDCLSGSELDNAIKALQNLQKKRNERLDKDEK